MKNSLFALLLVSSLCLSLSVKADAAADRILDAPGERAAQILFNGVKSVELKATDTGDLLMKASIEYDNQYEDDIALSDVKAKSLVIDKNFREDEDVFTLVYYDFCEKGCQLREYYKNFECGVYEPEKTAARQSFLFKKGVHTAVLTFNVGNLNNIALTNDASQKTPFNKDTNFVTSYKTINNLIRISNALNGIDKDNSTLVFVLEGNGHYQKNKGGQSTTVVIGEIKMASVLGRQHIDYIFQRKGLLK